MTTKIYEEPPGGIDMTLSDWSFPDAFKEAVASRLRNLDWRRYPANSAMAARQCIGARFGMAPENVLPTNGCTEALDLLARFAASEAASVALPSPGYFAYGTIMQASGLAVEHYDPASLMNFVPDANSHLLVCNPNNPTGDWLCAEDLHAIPVSTRRHIAIDSTYAFFRPDFGPALFRSYLAYGFINLLSFSKAFGVAGMRLGAIIAPAVLLQRISRNQPRYMLDFAQITALGTLFEENWYALAIQEGRLVHQAAVRLKNLLETIRGLKVYPANANFVSFQNRTPDGKEILPRRLLEDLPCKIWNNGLVRMTIDRTREADTFAVLSQWADAARQKTGQA